MSRSEDVLSVDFSTLLVQGESVVEQLRGAPAGAFGSVSVERLAAGLEQQVLDGRDLVLRRGLAEGDWDDARYDVAQVFADIAAWRLDLREALAAARPADAVVQVHVTALLTTTAPRLRRLSATLEWLIDTMPTLRAQTQVLRASVAALVATVEVETAAAATGGPGASPQDLDALDALGDALAALDRSEDLAAGSAAAVSGLTAAAAVRAAAAQTHDLARTKLRADLRRVRSLWGPAMARAKTLPALDLTYAAGAHAGRRRRAAEAPPEAGEGVSNAGEGVSTAGEPVSTTGEEVDKAGERVSIAGELVVHVVS